MFKSKLFTQILGRNWKWLVLATAVLAAFEGVVFLAGKNLMSVIGMTTMLSKYYFGVFAITIIPIYTIILANRLLAAKVDNGEMAHILATPTTRNQISGTSILYLVGSLLVNTILLFAFGIGMNSAIGGNLDIGNFAILSVGNLLLQLAISSIAFFASSASNRSSTSLLIGGGIPAAMLLFYVFGKMWDKLGFIENFSLFSLYAPSSILKGSAFMPQFIIMAVITAVLFGAGVASFRRRDLPL